MWHKTIVKQQSAKETIQLPAYLRYQQLIKPPTQLPLPKHLEFLKATFDGLESVYVFYKGRGQELEFAFDKIKKAVSNVTNRYASDILETLSYPPVATLSDHILVSCWVSIQNATKSKRPK
jgi:hypothetical protein